MYHLGIEYSKALLIVFSEQLNSCVRLCITLFSQHFNLKSNNCSNVVNIRLPVQSKFELHRNEANDGDGEDNAEYDGDDRNFIRMNEKLIFIQFNLISIEFVFWYLFKVNFARECMPSKLSSRKFYSTAWKMPAGVPKSHVRSSIYVLLARPL